MSQETPLHASKESGLPDMPALTTNTLPTRNGIQLDLIQYRDTLTQLHGQSGLAPYGIFLWDLVGHHQDQLEGRGIAGRRSAISVLHGTLPSEWGYQEDIEAWRELLKFLKEVSKAGDRALVAVVSEIIKFGDPAFVDGVRQIKDEIFFSWYLKASQDFIAFVNTQMGRGETAPITAEELTSVQMNEILTRLHDDSRWAHLIAGGNISLLHHWLRFYFEKSADMYAVAG